MITGRAEAQGVGFQGGVSVDPEQVFVGTHLETGELFRSFRFTSVHAGTFVTFGFAHENGFFTDFKLGNGTLPTLKFAVGYTVRKKTP